MRKILKNFLLLFVVGVLAYQFRFTLNAIFLPLWNEIKERIFTEVPCSLPIPYLLSNFDTKFNISEKYFLSALSDAEAIWEKPLGKDLFVYAPLESASSNILKINLVYDYRQQATSKLASLGIVVKDTKASYDELRAKFTALKTEYDKEKSALLVRIENFNQKSLTYENEVKSWNKKGGAPQGEYDRIERARLELEVESQKLKTIQARINEMVDEINALVVVLNRLVISLNLSVEKYNTTNVSRGESFEEGVYTSDGFNRQIDIYEFSSREKLVRVLAHELGHALGLEHVDDPKAIMYKLNQSNNQTLTQTDLVALKIKCQVKQ